MENRKLEALLANAQGLEEFKWLRGVGLSNATDVTPSCMEPLPLERVIAIYTRRARINAIHGCPINGFDYLLHMLSSATDDKVRISSLLRAGGKYFVFTDPRMNKLFGVLGPLTTESTRHLRTCDAKKADDGWG